MMDHKGTLLLETDRLILRKFETKDVEDMFNNWASDSEVTKYLTWTAHSCVEGTKEVINYWISRYENSEHYQWAIELKEIGSVIGSISLMNIDKNIDNCEIGYCIGKAYWNMGIVSEAFNRVIDFAFKIVGFQRITGRHHTDNPASGKVMEKCGLKYEGLLRKISRNNKGELVDCKYYSILRDEYIR